MYRLMDVLHLGLNVVPFKKFGNSDLLQPHLHLLVEDSVDSVTKKREGEFKEAELKLLSDLQREGIPLELIKKEQQAWEIRFKK
jgi:hypothetical protein